MAERNRTDLFLQRLDVFFLRGARLGDGNRGPLGEEDSVFRVCQRSVALCFQSGDGEQSEKRRRYRSVPHIYLVTFAV